MSEQKNEVCRLCYYETVDTTDIFSEDGMAFDYIGKINKYLYFSVCINSKQNTLKSNFKTLIVGGFLCGSNLGVRM